jgi:hypothetical protein
MYFYEQLFIKPLLSFGILQEKIIFNFIRFRIVTGHISILVELKVK